MKFKKFVIFPYILDHFQAPQSIAMKSLYASCVGVITLRKSFPKSFLRKAIRKMSWNLCPNVHMPAQCWGSRTFVFWCRGFLDCQQKLSMASPTSAALWPSEGTDVTHFTLSLSLSLCVCVCVPIAPRLTDFSRSYLEIFRAWDACRYSAAPGPLVNWAILARSCYNWPMLSVADV